MEYIYYWYDHCFLRGSGIEKDIEDCIKRHDWVKFQCYQKILNNMVCEEQNNEKWLYLPNEVTVYDKDEYYGTLELTEQVFNLISYSEYECG